MRTNRPYIYKCYFSIIDVAIPIIIDEQYLGAIMAGQVLSYEQIRLTSEMLYNLSLKSTTEECKLKK